LPPRRSASNCEERTFQLKHIRSAQQVQEFATLVRAIGEVNDLSTNADQPSISLRGTPSQVALAEWLVNEMDTAPDRSPASRDLRLSPSGDDRVRIVYLSSLNSVQQLQEAATLVRSITEIRRLFTFNASKAIVARGTSEQLQAMEWLLPDFDRTGTDLAGREHRMMTQPDGVIRVFHLRPELPIQELQEVATLIRATGEIRRLFTFNHTRALAVRGTPENIQLAQWLVNELGAPPANAATPEYPMPGGDFVRVYYVRDAASPAQLQQIAVNVRRTSGVRHLFTYNAPKAVVIRGSAVQLATADRALKEQN
jgi:hypothetical protein